MPMTNAEMAVGDPKEAAKSILDNLLQTCPHVQSIVSGLDDGDRAHEGLQEQKHREYRRIADERKALQSSVAKIDREAERVPMTQEVAAQRRKLEQAEAKLTEQIKADNERRQNPVRRLSADRVRRFLVAQGPQNYRPRIAEIPATADEQFSRLKANLQDRQQFLADLEAAERAPRSIDEIRPLVIREIDKLAARGKPALRSMVYPQKGI